MGKARFIATSAGPHTSIQDGGRTGVMRFGVPASGPMDRRSFAIANALLGNPAGTPAIEVSLGGLSLYCESGAVTCAVAGGGFTVAVNGISFSAWSVFSLKAGDQLDIRPGHWGSWTYLAFRGDLRCARWSGSASTHTQSGLGGGSIKAGSVLSLMSASVNEALHGDVPCPVSSRPRAELHAVLGPQSRFFSADTIETFLTSAFRLSDSYDRMGVRLLGPPLKPDNAMSIPSEPIVYGAVQVNGEGAATILLADHQTTGGYPKIAALLADDLSGLVQRRPRDVIAFKAITPDAAIRLARHRARSHAAFIQRIYDARTEHRLG